MLSLFESVLLKKRACLLYWCT